MTNTFLKISSVFALSILLTSCDMAPVSYQQEKVRPEALMHYSKRPITDDIMYFVMPDRFNNGDTANDRGGLSGDRQVHGFDPTHKGFYHGGDLKGLTAKLDYLADMGISAIWMTPIFKNKAVELNGNNSHSSYHGYWITDFTQIDPHLGTNDDLKVLIKEAHKRNMKVIFDIITNHTADVIKYEECYSEAMQSAGNEVPLCPYRSQEDFPSDIYTPYVPQAESDIKVPAWLNNMQYYHNRGDSEWQGESSMMGDFAGLDDLNTKHSDVVNGFIDIYKHWITEFKIDGYRIDTVKHVNMEFWQQFAPAILEHAKAEGIEQFYMFGEVYNDGIDSKFLGSFVTEGKLPTVLDFGFTHAAKEALIRNQPASILKELYAGDHYYDSDNGSAHILPTFLGNHDMGRFGHYLFKENPSITSKEALERTKLAHALMYFTRGVPVIYYGDEQGFTGDGGDQDAREDMFASTVASYNDNRLIGSRANTADNNFNTSHALYKSFRELALVRRSHSALQGGEQSVLYASDAGGMLAIERKKAGDQNNIMVIFNASTTSEKAGFPLRSSTDGLCLIKGEPGEAELLDGQLTYVAPALSWAVYSLNGCKG